MQKQLAAKWSFKEVEKLFYATPMTQKDAFNSSNILQGQKEREQGALYIPHSAPPFQNGLWKLSSSLRVSGSQKRLRLFYYNYTAAELRESRSVTAAPAHTPATAATAHTPA
jgi:hypothetical protein